MSRIGNRELSCHPYFDENAKDGESALVRIDQEHKSIERAYYVPELSLQENRMLDKLALQCEIDPIKLKIREFPHTPGIVLEGLKVADDSVDFGEPFQYRQPYFNHHYTHDNRVSPMQRFNRRCDFGVFGIRAILRKPKNKKDLLYKLYWARCMTDGMVMVLTYRNMQGTESDFIQGQLRNGKIIYVNPNFIEIERKK